MGDRKQGIVQAAGPHHRLVGASCPRRRRLALERWRFPSAKPTHMRCAPAPAHAWPTTCPLRSTDEDTEASSSAASMSTTSRPDVGAAPGSIALLHTPQPSVEPPAARGGSSRASTAADSLLEHAERRRAAEGTAAAEPGGGRPPCKVASSICKAAARCGRLRPAPAADAQPAASPPLDPAAAAAALREQSALEAAAINRAAREQAARHAAERARAAAELEAVESARRCLQARLMLVRDTAALRREEEAAAAHGGTAGWGRAVAEMQGRLDAARQQAAAEYEAAEAAAAEEKARWAQRHSAAVAALAALQRAATAELQHLQAELGVALDEAAGSCASLAATAGAAGAEAAAAAHAEVMRQAAVQLPATLLPPQLLQPGNGSLKGGSGVPSAHASSVALVPTPRPSMALAAVTPPQLAAPAASPPAGDSAPAPRIGHGSAACQEASDEVWHDCEEADGHEQQPAAAPAAHASLQQPEAAADVGQSAGRRGAGRRRGQRRARGADQGGCCTIM